MSTGVIHPVQPLLKSKRVRIDSIALGASGYLNIVSYVPSGMNNFLFCLMDSYGSMSPTGGLGVTSDGRYIFGPSNATITYIIVIYYYTD